MAHKLKCSPDDLMTIMYSESSFEYNRKQGLFGFCLPGVDGRNMNPMQQLDWAEKFLLEAKNYTFKDSHVLSGKELYALNFVPGEVCNIYKKRNVNPYEEPLVRKGTKYWNPTNTQINYNNDDKITMNELDTRLKLKYNEAMTYKK